MKASGQEARRPDERDVRNLRLERTVIALLDRLGG